MRAVIKSCATDWSAETHIALTLDIAPNLSHMPEAIERSVFRIVQEGLATSRSTPRQTRRR